MTRNTTRWFGALAVTLALGACSDGTDVPDGLTADEADALASAMMDGAFGTSGEVAVASTDPAGIGPLVTVTRSFERTRDCPLGGDVTFTGTREREWDAETMSGSMDLTMTKTHNDCGRTIRGHEVVVNGDPNIQVKVHRAREAGDWSGQQTMSMLGKFTWDADDDRSGSCAVDISVVYDPDAATRTVTGTFCGRTIDRTTPWTRD